MVKAVLLGFNLLYRRSLPTSSRFAETPALAVLSAKEPFGVGRVGNAQVLRVPLDYV